LPPSLLSCLYYGRLGYNHDYKWPVIASNHARIVRTSAIVAVYVHSG
jgi:hypothetical protein